MCVSDEDNADESQVTKRNSCRDLEWVDLGPISSAACAETTLDTRAIYPHHPETGALVSVLQS